MQHQHQLHVLQQQAQQQHGQVDNRGVAHQLGLVSQQQYRPQQSQDQSEPQQLLLGRAHSASVTGVLAAPFSVDEMLSAPLVREP